MVIAATYIPHSYGQGLMPDTFLDFKKQRFRWAYGAVLIMRQHLAQLLGLEKSGADPRTAVSFSCRLAALAGGWLQPGLQSRGDRLVGGDGADARERWRHHTSSLPCCR